jgi:hypothetical protein
VWSSLVRLKFTEMLAMRDVIRTEMRARLAEADRQREAEARQRLYNLMVPPPKPRVTPGGVPSWIRAHNVKAGY